MKSRKKYFIMGAMILFFFVVAGFGLIAASGPPGFCDRSPCPMFHGKGFHPRFFGKDFSEHVLGRMDSRVEELDLSEIQTEQYEKIREKLKIRLTEAMENRREFFIQLHDEINKDNPNIDTLSDLINQHIRKMTDFMSENLNLFVEFYTILDENQKAKLLENARKKMSWLGSTISRD
jgi:Spy/CpxP family protein refolding chaperone